MVKLKWLRRASRSEEQATPPSIPRGQRVYAVGDIHGRADLLAGLLALIQRDMGEALPATNFTLVFLGDYVDRGFDSPGVIELLQPLDLPKTKLICLKGNHEEVFMKFLQDVSFGPSWFAIGGDATALGYGVKIPPEFIGPKKFAYAQNELRKTVPWHHIEFLVNLHLSFSLGDYYFVHAGVRPNLPLDRQHPSDLLWIRDEFLSWEGGFEKVVVHGHSLTHVPVAGRYRIGIDTGAYATNLLTCLVLEGQEQRFLTTRL